MSLRVRHSSSDSSENYIFNSNVKVYKPRANFVITNFFEINEKFRVSFSKVEEILSIIGPQIQHTTDKNFALTPMQQLLTLLHWLGNGGQYHGIADIHAISKATVCRCVQRVSDAIVNPLFKKYVRWPAEHEDVRQKFHNIAGMPHVYGCIDGTLVNIDSPNECESAYVDRHGNHSINCMLVCGPDFTFYDAYVNWPGSAHDSWVLRRSPLFQKFESGFRPFHHAVLLGDSGYPSKDWLITPIFRQSNAAANRYNRAHKSTRRIIENAIGILKEKFPCLQHLRLQPKRAVVIIKCCVVLTNISRQTTDNDFDFPTTENADDTDNMDVINNEISGPLDGQATLEYFLSYFQ